MAPINRFTHLIGNCLHAVTYGVIRSTLILVLVVLSFVGLGLVAAVLPTIVLLLVIGIILIPLGIIVFRQAEFYAKKTGKLKRSG